MNLTLTYSFWWIFICLLAGGVYAWVQYSKTAPWSTRVNYGLASFRWILISLLCFLFLEPYLTKVTNEFQEPVFIIAIDNSTSVIAKNDEFNATLIDELNQVKGLLKNQGYDVAIVDLEGQGVGEIDSIKFNRNTTNLSKQINRFKNNFDNTNVGGVALFSDGIFNQGYSPLSILINYPMYTIGLGDTSKIRDLAIAKVVHNATVFEGNSLMLEVHVLNSGFEKVSTELKVWSKGKLLKQQQISFLEDQLLNKTIIAIPMKGNGKQSLTIEIIPVDGEFTVFNNKQNIYVDVIDSQKKILIIAASPHPDIKAIKTSIEKNEYYTAEVAYELPNNLDYDLIIAHQYPSTNTSSKDKNRFLDSSTSKWLIIGGRNDARFLKQSLGFNIVGADLSKSDLVKPLLNTSFDKFKISAGFLPWVADLPHLATPYGVSFKDPQLKVFLKQQIGSVTTEFPLMFFTKNNGSNMGVLLGTNYWKWKLDEYRITQSSQYFDELISKTIQYLSADQRKSRLYVAPQKNIYEKGEVVLFDTQEYDALFEQITGKKVEFELKGENDYSQKYSYVPLSQNFVYKVSDLQEGVYSYAATVVMEDKRYRSSGQFVVKLLDLEVLNPTADFDLLKKMASKSGGEFYSFGDVNSFKSKIKEMEPVSIIHSTQKEESILNLTWVLGLLLLITTLEWFLRKFYGGY